jgi:TonB family protein
LYGVVTRRRLHTTLFLTFMAPVSTLADAGDMITVNPDRLAPALGLVRVEPALSVRDSMQVTGERVLTTDIRFCVDEEGALVTTKLLGSSGYPAFDQRVLDEIQGLRYRPYRVKDQPVRACANATFTYELPSSESFNPQRFDPKQLQCAPPPAAPAAVTADVAPVKRQTAAELRFLRAARREIERHISAAKSAGSMFTMFVCLDRDGALQQAEFASPPNYPKDAPDLRVAIAKIGKFPRPPLTIFNHRDQRVRIVVARFGNQIHVGVDSEQ